MVVDGKHICVLRFRSASTLKSRVRACLRDKVSMLSHIKTSKQLGGFVKFTYRDVLPPGVFLQSFTFPGETAIPFKGSRRNSEKEITEPRYRL